MSVNTSSQSSGAEWLTARPLLLFILLATEILAIDFFRLPETMSFDSYAFCDNGANLTLQYLIAHGLNPTIDFGYHYGLLPILVGRIWFAVAGLTPIAYQILIVIFDLAIVSAVARIAAHLRFNATSLALTAKSDSRYASSYVLRCAQGWKQCCYPAPSRISRHGKHRRSLILASAAAFANLHGYLTQSC